MSIKSQQKNMKTIHSLVSQDLGYIYGEQRPKDIGVCNASSARFCEAKIMSESGKKQFLSKSAAFLRALGNDLGFKEFKVTTNPGGIAVSGDIALMGLWSYGNGLYFQINQPLQPIDGFLYRTITNMKDYSGGINQWLPCNLFADGNYDGLITTLLSLKNNLEQSEVEHHAA